MNKKILIIGAGASGVFAAINAANKGYDVIMLEANDRPCKKILVTGNGRCNLTNESITSNDYYCEQKSFIDNILRYYTNTDTIKTFLSYGVVTKNKNGYYYPASMQAQTISDVLIRTCELNKIIIHTNTLTKNITFSSKDQLYYIDAIKVIYEKNTSNKVRQKKILSKEKVVYTADKIIIACGSNAGLTTANSDHIAESLVNLKHTVNKRIPALCSLYVNKEQEMDEQFFKKSAGVRTEIKVTALSDHKMLGESSGELQITDYGLSGIVIFQLSSIIGQMLYEKRTVEMNIDFIPEYSTSEILLTMINSENFEHLSLIDLLSGFINKKLAENLVNLYIKRTHKKYTLVTKNLDQNELTELLEFIKNCRFIILRTNDFTHAQVSHGGVSVNEINSETMESLKYRGLYFAGEIIDVDGICGGYNLQFAWSTGAIAGRNAAND